MSVINEKKYFLKNSNLLEEIHKSKISYCCYTNSEYTKYDVICVGYDLVTPNVIMDFFNKHPERDYIIIRVMTFEHIPEGYFDKLGKPNLQKLKLEPFKHFYLSKKDFNKVFKNFNKNLLIIDEKNNRLKEIKEEVKDYKKSIRFYKLNKQAQEPYKDLIKNVKKESVNLIKEIKEISADFSKKIKPKMVEVLRSHWSGDTIETGHFDVEQGRMTDNLAHMIILLVEQYARKGNWNRYTYLDDMKSSALVHLYDVALKFNEYKTNNPFAYLTTCMSMKFTATLNSEAVQRSIKSKLLQKLGYDPKFGEQIDDEFDNKQREFIETHSTEFDE